jgi:hypothetical protein
MSNERMKELFDNMLNHISELVGGNDLIDTLHCIGFTDEEIAENELGEKDNMPSPQEEFIEQLKSIRDYWLSLPKERSTKEIVDGVLFSLLVMFDGDSGMNDFHYLKIIDCKSGKRIDCGHLHEYYFREKECKQL